MTGPSCPAPRLRLALSLALRVAVLVAAVWALHGATDWLIARAEASARAHMLMAGLIAALVVAYALLIALPFVPGIEIGLTLLALRGSDIAPVVYAGTVAGLMLAYLAGYLLPPDWLEVRLRRLRLTRIAGFLAEIAALPPSERLALLRGRAPRRAARLALDWRYALLAILYNLPGNGLIGGGGGISLMAGLSRIFLPGPTLLTVALAVAPVPLFVWWFGLPWRPA